MMARLTTLPDALRGGAWPSPDTITASAILKFIVISGEVGVGSHS